MSDGREDGKDANDFVFFFDGSNYHRANAERTNSGIVESAVGFGVITTKLLPRTDAQPRKATLNLQDVADSRSQSSAAGLAYQLVGLVFQQSHRRAGRIGKCLCAPNDQCWLFR